MNLLIYLLVFLVIVAIYTAWRTKVAFYDREKTTEQTNELLAQFSLPDSLHSIVWNAYDDSLKPFFIYKAFFSILIWLLVPQLASLTDKADEIIIQKRLADLRALTERERSIFFGMVLRYIVVNIKIAPLSYVFISVLTLIVGVIPLIIYLSFSRKSKHWKNIRIEELLVMHG